MRYHVKVLVPHEFYIEAESFEDCMIKVTDELPHNYNGDGISIEPVNNNEETVAFK